MTKKARKNLEDKLTQHVTKKYPDQIEKVTVIDKNNCVITIEVEPAKKYVDVTLPIAALGYQV